MCCFNEFNNESFCCPVGKICCQSGGCCDITNSNNNDAIIGGIVGGVGGIILLLIIILIVFLIYIKCVRDKYKVEKGGSIYKMDNKIEMTEITEGRNDY